MTISTKTKTDPEVRALISILMALCIAGFAAALLMMYHSKPSKEIHYRCVDGIKYEVKNGNELHIQLTNNGHAFRC